MTTALFLLDAILDALMIVLAVRLAGERIRFLRVAFGALAGAAVALAARRLSLSGGQAALLCVPAALVMMTIAMGTKALQRPLRSAALLLCAAGLLGGAVLSLCGATQSYALAYAVGSVCTVYIAIIAIRARRQTQSAVRFRLRCRYRGKSAMLEAMADSGNTLRDYLTHRPVIVMPEARGKTCFALEGALLRPIFADTAGGRQMMYCFSPEEICLMEGERKRCVRAVVALSPAMRGDAPALVPAALLWDEETE